MTIPSRTLLVEAVEDALRAPSVHNTQPWRWRIGHDAIELHCLRSLTEHAARTGALLVPVTDPAVHSRLLALLVDAAHEQSAEPGYAAELRMWSERPMGSHDGVPAANVAAPPAGALGPSPLRRFPRTGLPQPHQQPGHGPGDDAAELLVVATSGDDDLDRLRAGEATSAVLLAATQLGLATTPLSQALELSASREHLQRQVLHVPEHPQLLIRVGWPASGATELPATPRRGLAHVLLS